MPALAAEIVVEALRMIRLVPRIGLPFLDSIDERPLYRKLVIVRRRWSYRVVYELVRKDVVVHFIDPSWVDRRTVADD